MGVTGSARAVRDTSEMRALRIEHITFCGEIGGKGRVDCDTVVGGETGGMCWSWRHRYCASVCTGTVYSICSRNLPA